MKLLHIHHFYIARKTSCLPPKNFCISKLSSVSLMMTAYSKEKLKQFSCKFYGRCKNYGE